MVFIIKTKDLTSQSMPNWTMSIHAQIKHKHTVTQTHNKTTVKTIKVRGTLRYLQQSTSHANTCLQERKLAGVTFNRSKIYCDSHGCWNRDTAHPTATDTTGHVTVGMRSLAHCLTRAVRYRWLFVSSIRRVADRYWQCCSQTRYKHCFDISKDQYF